ncbi:DUF2514 domain-containing protein [Pseudomonas sp. NPDC089392]|uniref:DUF2514 domain-containing protein n=1 Tax=Pseudomonas sp. NPDC089392 TaxID=3364459 RepID=UPI00380E72F5
MSPLAVASVGTVLLASHWLAYEHGRSLELAQAVKLSALRDSGDRLAELISERSARREEQRRAAAQEESRAHAKEEQRSAHAGAAGANSAGQRLRDEARKLASDVSCPGADSAALARGQAATRAAMVLSELLNRSVDTNRELAAAYDQARIAGYHCEGEYGALTPPS